MLVQEGSCEPSEISINKLVLGAWKQGYIVRKQGRMILPTVVLIGADGE